MSNVAYTEHRNGPPYTPGGTNYSWVMGRSGVRQKPPINKNVSLPYTYSLFKGKYSTGVRGHLPRGANAVSWQSVELFRDGIVTHPSELSRAGKLAYNKAYTKLLNRLHGDAADILTLIRERKLLADMIFNRTHQVADLVDEARSFTSARGNTSSRAQRHRKMSLDRIAAILSTTPKGVRQKTATLRKREGLLTTPAELILELRWGWAPLISDIQAALTGLAEPIPYLPISGSAGYPIDFKKIYSSGNQWMSQKSKGIFRVKVGGMVAIDNSMTAAFERVGMTNVFQSLWETTPYSWLVDYFSSVGEVISSLDDSLIGKLSYPYYTFYAKGTEDLSYLEFRGTPIEMGWHFGRDRVHMVRAAPSTLPAPQLVVHAPDLSPWRIATAVSILVLKIKGIRNLGL